MSSEWFKPTEERGAERQMRGICVTPTTFTTKETPGLISLGVLLYDGHAVNLWRKSTRGVVADEPQSDLGWGRVPFLGTRPQGMIK